MSSSLRFRLFELERKHGKPAAASKHLRVFYGWAKLGKVRKKEAISVIFENDCQNDERTLRAINKYQRTCYVRQQTEQEKRDAEGAIRMFTEYSIFLSERTLQGSLELALQANSNADKNHVALDERTKIANALRSAYMLDNPDYREPVVQLELNFEA